MKRYLAFACLQYYPSGGMQDCVGSFDELHDAKIALCQVDYGGMKDSYVHGHIFDLHEAKIVFAYNNDGEVSETLPEGDLPNLLNCDF